MTIKELFPLLGIHKELAHLRESLPQGSEHMSQGLFASDSCSLSHSQLEQVHQDPSVVSGESCGEVVQISRVGGKRVLRFLLST